MSGTTTREQRPTTAEVSHSPRGHEHGAHSMMRGMMLLCAVGMVAGVIGWVVGRQRRRRALRPDDARHDLDDGHAGHEHVVPQPAR